MSRALVVATILALAACRSNAKSGGAPLKPGNATLYASSSGKRVEVGVGPFAIELTSPRTPGYRFEWGEPSVSSGVVASRSKEVLEPDPSVDGGRFRHVYRFDAVSPGSATITITPANGPDLPPPFTVDVVVR